MKKLGTLALAITGLTLGSYAFAQSNTASTSANSTARVVTPISIAKTADMNFGDVVAGGSAGTVVLAQRDGRSHSRQRGRHGGGGLQRDRSGKRDVLDHFAGFDDGDERRQHHDRRYVRQQSLRNRDAQRRRGSGSGGWCDTQPGREPGERHLHRNFQPQRHIQLGRARCLESEGLLRQLLVALRAVRPRTAARVRAR